jgi:hypothetical protein
MDDEGEAADVAEMPGRVEQARLDVEFMDDFLEIVVRDFRLGCLVQSRPGSWQSMVLMPTTFSKILGDTSITRLTLCIRQRRP